MRFTNLPPPTTTTMTAMMMMVVVGAAVVIVFEINNKNGNTYCVYYTCINIYGFLR